MRAHFALDSFELLIKRINLSFKPKQMLSYLLIRYETKK